MMLEMYPKKPSRQPRRLQSATRANPQGVSFTENYLTDQRWALIASRLPGKEGDPGCHGRDNRLFIEAVLWIVRTGSPWRRLPPHFGKWYTNYTRFHRWTQKRVWLGVLDALAADETSEYSYKNGVIYYDPSAGSGRKLRRRSRILVSRNVERREYVSGK